MPGLDPHNARAVLGGLTRRLDRALEARGLAWRCSRALPRVDGSVALTFGQPQEREQGTRGQGKRRELGVLWVAPEEASPAAPWGGLVSPELEGEARGRELRLAIAETLERVAGSAAFALLGFPNRNLRALQWGDTVVDTMLADRCAPGHTRWFEWRLAEVFQGAMDRFMLHFDGPPGRLTLAVTAPGAEWDGATAIVRAAAYWLWIVAEPRSEEARQRLSGQVERFVGFLMARAVPLGIPVEGLGRVTFDGGARGGAPQVDPYGRGSPVSTARWGNPRQWHQFFSDFEVARAGLCGMVFAEPQSFVTHGEPECHRVEPPVRPRPHVFARLPFSERHMAPILGSREFAVVVGERDLVFGATEPLARALELAEAHESTRFVVLNTTCLPKMAGDDVASLVSERRTPGRKPFIAMNTDLESPEATYHDLVRQTASSPGVNVAPGERAGLALVGFTPGRARDELGALCEKLGFPVAGCLGPEVSPARAEAIRGAALHVIYPAAPWPELHSELIGALGAPAVSPPAPYGMEASREWFVAAAEGLARDGASVRDRFDAEVAPLARRFVELRDRVEGVGLALVVDEDEIDRLTESARCYGVRLLALLSECGFALTVLVRQEPRRAGEPLGEETTERLRAEVRAGAELHLVAFETEEELHDLLAGGRFRGVYSEVACDDRLGRHGLVGFGLDVWEQGPAGAVRSLERMERLARWPFFERYGRWCRPGARTLVRGPRSLVRGPRSTIRDP